jgi:hypothetical protein
MANVTNVGIELGEDGYRIRCGTDHSEVTQLGEGIEWRAPNGKLYLAFCDTEGGQEESGSIESQFEHYVYEVRPIPEADVEEVEFEGEGEVDDEDEVDEDEVEGAEEGDEAEDEHADK